MPRQDKCPYLKYSCVAAFEGAGKPLSECSMVTVSLTLFSEDDDSPAETPPPSSELIRQRRVMRLAEEQGNRAKTRLDFSCFAEIFI